MDEIELFFATPVIVSPQTHLQEFEFEIDRMLARSQATSQWLRNEMITEDFFEVLYSNGVEPYLLVELWDSGHSSFALQG